jgi:micrococcal nuclease
MQIKHIIKQLIKFLKSSKNSQSSLILTGVLLFFIIILLLNINISNYHQDWTQNPYEVVDVIDGDTIEVQGNFANFRVRYIGIDTPELGRNNQNAECFGDEARAFNASLLKDKKVYLENDKENKDRFGRELRYVYVKNNNNEFISINEELLKNGYADILFIEPNIKYKESYTQIRNNAKQNKVGKWGVCY